MAKATPAQLRALKKARAAKRRYAGEAPRRRRRRSAREEARRLTIRRGVKGRFLKRKVRGFAKDATEARRRRRRRYAREAPIATEARRRRRPRRRYAREAPIATEARRRRRRARPRRRYARASAYEARRRRRRYGRRYHAYEMHRRGARRYRGALENPLSGIELGITILTGSVGFMAAELADRYMAIREGAPNVQLVVNGGKAPQLPMYDDWPRLLVAGAVTGAPLIASAFVRSPVWRSALQTMGIGAGLRSVGNILVGIAAQLTMPSKDKPQTAEEAKKNIFAFEQSLESAYKSLKEAEKAKEKGTSGLPEGVGSCPHCNRTDGLGACCKAYGAPTPRAQAPLPPPPPITAEAPSPPPAREAPSPMMPPTVARPERPAPPAVPPTAVPPPPPTFTPSTPPVSTVPGSRTEVTPPLPAAPPAAFAPFAPAARGPAGLPRFMAGVGAVAPRPNFNWGHQGREEDAA